MAYDPNSLLPNWGVGTPNSIAGMPRYGTGPGDLGMGDPRGFTAPTLDAPSMGFPAVNPPAISMATPPRVLRNPASVAAPLPPVRPNLNVPVGQVAQTPQPGNANLWDALRALFSGQPSAQGQGMSGMLQSRGQGGPSTDALGNPFNRFG